MRRLGKYRHNYWARAVIVGVLLIGEIHVFCAEIFHQHREATRFCQVEHQGGRYLHAGQQLTPLCPLCQIVRNGSVRPAVRSVIQKVDRESPLQLVTQKTRYSPNLTQSLLARGPPLS